MYCCWIAMLLPGKVQKNIQLVFLPDLMEIKQTDSLKPPVIS